MHAIGRLLELSSLLLLVTAYSVPRNIPVDDEYGDGLTGLVPTYSDGWMQGASCEPCSNSSIPGSLDISTAFRGTWHNTTDDPSGERSTMQFTFHGTAVYAYAILSNRNLTSLSFTIDGQFVDVYVHLPEENSDYTYNVTIYANETLPNGNHTFGLSTVQSPVSNLLLFDYLEYTYDPDPKPPTPPPSTARPNPQTIAPPSPSQISASSSVYSSLSNPTAILGGVTITLVSAWLLIAL